MADQSTWYNYLLVLWRGIKILIYLSGLACDTVLSYTLVLPNGTVTEVDSKQPDLFFALKGGLNRFGIVTQITFKLFPSSPQVYVSNLPMNSMPHIKHQEFQSNNMQGGYQVFVGDSIAQIINATATFSNTNTDPKAQVITSLSYLAGIPEAVLLSFYDGPTRPAAFAPFDNIQALSSDVSTRTFSSLAKSSPDEASANTRGAFHTLSTTGYTLNFLNAVLNETKFYGSLAALHSGVFIDYDIEPFLKTYGQYATDSAYPHDKSPLPLNLYFTWLDPSEDTFWRTALQTSVNTLAKVAKTEGIFDASAPAYPNYALSTYSGVQVYGAQNDARLKAIKASVDPNGVMDLTGGFTL